MSQRSIVRARRREEVRASRRRIRRAAAAGAMALSGGIALAPAADAASFEVSNTDDAGAGSLRAAIEAANLDATADVITFAPGLNGTITLSSGELVVDAPLDIQGPGAETLAVSGDDNSRIFFLDAGDVGDPRDPVSISGLTLSDGDASEGGAVYAYETDMTLSELVIADNYAGGDGGAIDIERSPVTIDDSRITGNESGSDAGVMYTDGDNGATNSQDTVTITDSVIDGNVTAGNGGAFYFDNATGGDIVIERTVIEGNEAAGVGGGIHFYGHKGSQTIRDSSITGNASNGDGGGIYIDTDYYDPDGFLVENTTISGNEAGSEGGGVFVENSDEKPMRFRNSTIADNRSAELGGGIFRDGFDVSLSSTIVAGNDNLGGEGDDLAESPAATEQFTIGFSLVEQDTGGVTIVEDPAGSNRFGVDPQLAALGDNGGPTPTQVLPLSSPAIDAGIANGLTTDQRGLTRTVEVPEVPNATGSDGTDMGATEVQVTPVPPPDNTVTGAAFTAKRTQKVEGWQIKVKVNPGAAEAAKVFLSGEIKAGKKAYPTKGRKVSLAPNQTATVALKPKSKKVRKKIAAFLAGRKKAKANVSALFTDTVGNEVTKTAKVNLKAAKKKR